MQKKILKSYAHLIAKMGANIKKGDVVKIRADVDQPEFVAMLTEECYKLGASKVMVELSYQPLSKLHVKYRTLRSLSTVEDWEIEKWKYEVDKLPAMIYLISEDPDGLRGMNQAKNAKASQAVYKQIKQFRDAMENKNKWCIAAVPGAKWAKKMFKGVREAAAIEKLWKAILYTSRVIDRDGNPLDPVEEWKKHNANLRAKCEYLNSIGIDYLHYTASNGTDFKVGLMEQSTFCGGDEPTLLGEYFNANIPSEECYTSPKKGIAEGIVHASMPLSYRGEIIDKFWVRFEGGRVVESHAEVNDALLTQMLSMDEGASYLGECALVPYDSPICQSGLLFYETLFDENASCHLALGAGYTNTVRDYGNYTLEECREMGINDSMIHVDFMIGTPDLDIVAHARDGRDIQVFKNGNWAF